MKYYSKDKKFYKFNIKEELKIARTHKTFEAYTNYATFANNFLAFSFRPHSAIWFQQSNTFFGITIYVGK